MPRRPRPPAPPGMPPAAQEEKRSRSALALSRQPAWRRLRCPQPHRRLSAALQWCARQPGTARPPGTPAACPPPSWWQPHPAGAAPLTPSPPAPAPPALALYAQQRAGRRQVGETRAKRQQHCSSSGGGSSASSTASGSNTATHVRPQLGLLILHDAASQGLQEGIRCHRGIHQLLHRGLGACGTGGQAAAPASGVRRALPRMHACMHAASRAAEYGAASTAVQRALLQTMHSGRGSTCVGVGGQGGDNRLRQLRGRRFNKGCSRRGSDAAGCCRVVCCCW